MAFSFWLVVVLIFGAGVYHGMVRNELHISRFEPHVEMEIRRRAERVVVIEERFVMRRKRADLGQSRGGTEILAVIEGA